MYKTRKDAEKDYRKLGDEAFKRMMAEKAVKYNPLIPDLLHLSLTDDLSNKWLAPKPPMYATDDDSDIKWSTEIAPVRFSCAPTLEGCYLGCFLQWDQHYNEQIKREHEIIINSFLYRVIPNPNMRVLLNQTIVDYKLIYDAFKTQEHGILNEFKIEIVESIDFLISEITSPKEDIIIHPYDDKRYAKRFIGHEMKIVKRKKV